MAEQMPCGQAGPHPAHDWTFYWTDPKTGAQMSKPVSCPGK